MRSGRVIVLSDPMRNTEIDTGPLRSNKKLRNRSGCSNIQWQSSGIDPGTRRAIPSARNWIGSTREWIDVDRLDCRSTIWIGPTYIFPMKSYQKVIQSKGNEFWLTLMEEKIDFHKINNIWELVILSPDRKTLPSHLVFKKEIDPTGKFIWYKSDLVFKASWLMKNIDYYKTFIIIVKSMIWKSLLAL